MLFYAHQIRTFAQKDPVLPSRSSCPIDIRSCSNPGRSSAYGSNTDCHSALGVVEPFDDCRLQAVVSHTYMSARMRYAPMWEGIMITLKLFESIKNKFIVQSGV